jgi:hypothetical protein
VETVFIGWCGVVAAGMLLHSSPETATDRGASQDELHDYGPKQRRPPELWGESAEQPIELRHGQLADQLILTAIRP